ncbi:TcpQ domain-containing protein [Ralstonia chuxiongensis]|uniref:TcpQ domain-containing protein n=1 Tax=Ralstonia chuxiongensis TaxID=2957504 RepID=UPI0028F4DCBA|nr:TcpQ domain-containing protein [Ralstonia chuxiongensis]CAJ0781280.1 hypothetical protein R8510_04853 [Ralstonia chuxiongensis]
MRPDLPRMLLAAAALAACFNLPTAHAATAQQIAIPEESDGLSGNGWQLLSPSEPSPNAATKKPGAVSNQSAASAASPKQSSAAGSLVGLAAMAPKAPQSEGTAASSATSSASVSPPVPFALVAGESVESQLLAWAKLAQWNVLWNVHDTWLVPGNKDYGTDFESAVRRVTEDLAVNGADILGDSWRGNRTIVISQNGAAGQ